MEKMKLKKEITKRCLALNMGKIKEESKMTNGVINLQDPTFKLIYDSKDLAIWTVRDDAYLHISGLPFAAVTKLNLFSIFNPKAEGYVIVTDMYYEQLPDVVKQFMIVHEVGHIMHKHHNINNGNMTSIYIKRSLGFIPEMEFEADEYAAESIGVYNVIKSLEYLYNYTDLGIVNKMEFKKRIERLMR